MARNNTRLQVQSLTVSAMLCALGVVILALGALIEVIDLSVGVIASLLCIYAVIELKGAYPWMIWLVTSIVGYLLLPLKTPVIFYALFFGFYPIIKEKAEKLSSPLSWVVKLITLHVSLLVILLTLWLFFPELLSGMGQLLFLVGMYVASLVVFVLYDVALTRIITFYFIRLRHRFRFKQ